MSSNIKKIFIPTLIVMVSILVISIPDAKASGVAYQSGDIFAGVGGGLIKHYSSSGVLMDTLDTTSSSFEETGMCFDASGNLYTTNFEAGTTSKLDNMGNLISANWAGPYNVNPESCVLDKAGNVYVSEVDGLNQIQKFNQSGNLLATYSPNAESRGTDWIDLAADQCTMYYTSEGTSVKRFDVCSNTQLADFSTGLSGPCYALRILSSGDVLVACSNQLYRLDATGAIAQTYPLPSGETSFLFAMNVDPDGKTFWTAGYNTGNIYHIDITTGNVLGSFNAPPNTFSVAGITLFGEPTVGCAPNCPQPVHVDTVLSSTSISLGSSFTDNATLSNVTPNAGGTITYNVYNSTVGCTGTPLFTDTKPVTNAKATPSIPFTPTVVGTYNIQASYSGDTNNLGASSECPSETLTVTPVTVKPALTTHLSNLQINLGRIIIDSATLTGVTPNAGGTVTYIFYFGDVCMGTPVFIDSEPVANGIVTNSAPFKPTKVGPYSVLAVYTGDANNKGLVSKIEHFIVVKLPSTHVATKLATKDKSVRDMAFFLFVTPNAGGTVTYNFYSGNACTGTPLFTDTEPVVNGKATPSAIFTPTQPGTYNAQAVYSGDVNNKGGTSICGSEMFTVEPEGITISIPSATQ